MKTFSKHALVLHLLFASGLAQANNNIVAAEAFIDSLGTEGSGTEVSTSSLGDVYQIAQSFPIATLADGVHKIYIRTQDVDGNW